MNYIIDTQALYYCADIFTYKTYHGQNLYLDIATGRNLYLSLWSIIEMITKPDLKTNERQQVLDFIYENELLILPSFIDTGFSKKYLNNYLHYYNYRFIDTKLSFSDSSNIITINTYKLKKHRYHLPKRQVKKHSKKASKQIINEKILLEKQLFHMYFNIAYFEFFQFYFTLISNQDKNKGLIFEKKASRLLEEYTKDFNIKYEKILGNSYKKKTFKERQFFLKTTKQEFDFDFCIIHLLLSKLIKTFDSNYDLEEFINSQFIKDETYKTASGQTKTMEDYIDKNVYSGLETACIEMTTSLYTGYEKIVFKNYFKYLSTLNFMQLYHGKRIEKNDMFDALFFTYHPNFLLFTIDRKVKVCIERINTSLFDELNNFVLAHP